MGIRIADPKMGGRRKRRIPLLYHGCAVPIFLFVFVMFNIFYMVVPILGAIIGIIHFFYIKRGRSADEFDQPLAFLKNFKFSDTGDILRSIIVSPLIAVAVFAPFRGIFSGVIHLFRLEKAWDRNFPTGDFFLDPFFGLCGLVLGIAVGTIVWTRGLKLRSQLANLPTSTVGSVAIGLAELKGIARSLKEGPIKEIGTDGKDGPATPVLSNTFYIVDGKVKGKSVCSPFYLEDETGKILVDTIGAEFWDGSGNFLWSPIRSIYLEKRYTEEIMPWKSTSLLLSGDPVYVIGHVEENKDVSPDASDADRLIIRPSAELEKTSIFKRLLFGEKARTMGTDIYHVFFLTDVTERDAAELLFQSLKKLWVWIFIWLVLSLSLLLPVSSFAN
jgi:hypothetical protein